MGRGRIVAASRAACYEYVKAFSCSSIIIIIPVVLEKKYSTVILLITNFFCDTVYIYVLVICYIIFCLFDRSRTLEKTAGIVLRMTWKV